MTDRSLLSGFEDWLLVSHYDADACSSLDWRTIVMDLVERSASQHSDEVSDEHQWNVAERLFAELDAFLAYREDEEAYRAAVLGELERRYSATATGDGGIDAYVEVDGRLHAIEAKVLPPRAANAALQEAHRLSRRLQIPVIFVSKNTVPTAFSIETLGEAGPGSVRWVLWRPESGKPLRLTAA